MRKTLVAVSAIAFGAGSVAAQPLLVVGTPAPPTKIVSYADLNLDSKSGQQHLVNRIRAAASAVCFEDNKEQVEFAMARRGCYKAALDDGMGQMTRAIAARASGVSIAAATVTIRGQ